MRKINIAAIFFLTIILFLPSCTKKKTTPELQDMRPDKTFIDLSVEGKKDSIIVRSTQPWKLSKQAGAEWLHLSVETGSAGKTIVYLIADTNVTTSARTTTLTLDNLGNYPVDAVRVTVQQSRDVRIKYSPSFGALGGATFTIE